MCLCLRRDWYLAKMRAFPGLDPLDLPAPVDTVADAETGPRSRDSITYRETVEDLKKKNRRPHRWPGTKERSLLSLTNPRGLFDRQEHIPILADLTDTRIEHHQPHFLLQPRTGDLISLTSTSTASLTFVTSELIDNDRHCLASTRQPLLQGSFLNDPSYLLSQKASQKLALLLYLSPILRSPVPGASP